MSSRSIANNDFLYLAENLTAHKYRFASSMPYIPHFYSLRKNWEDENKFEKCVSLIREYGYQKSFGKRTFTYFDINEHQYWTMGSALSKTTLINRAVTNFQSDYDILARSYDNMYLSDNCLRQNKEIMDMLGNIQNKSVLDIGSGTGFLLDQKKIKDYTGIEPSFSMIDVFNKKHPNYSGNTINTNFESFYSGRQFDCIISLFGSPSYISKNHLKRIRHFLKDNGFYFLMFYKKKYKPHYYGNVIQKADIKSNEMSFKDSNEISYDTYNIITNL